MSKNLFGGAVLLAVAGVALFLIQRDTAAFFFCVGAVVLGVASIRAKD